MLDLKNKNFVLLQGLFDALEFGEDSFKIWKKPRKKEK
jgi:hypothetical protein